MRNTSAFRIAAFFLILAVFCDSPGLLAESSENTIKINETSRPVFDPKIFEGQPAPPGEFMQKIRDKRSEFLAELNDDKRVFFEKLYAKNLEPEAFQKKVAVFHAKQKAQKDKYFRKQQKKLDKHKYKHDKDKPLFFYEQLDAERKEFFEKQKEDKRKAIEKLQRLDYPNREFQEQLSQYEEKAAAKREKFLAKQEAERNKYIKKVSQNEQ